MHPVPPCAWAENIERFLLAVVYFDSTPTPSPLGGRHTGRLRNRGNLLCRDGERDGRGAESSGRKKAWPSINRSIFSALPYTGRNGGRLVYGNE
jgi:hypothetical protein